MLEITIVFPVVLLAYMYALTHWDVVRRPTVFLIGLVALLLAFVGKVFYIFTATEHDWQSVIDNIFMFVGLTAAFWAFAIACFGAKLPLEKAFGFDLRSKEDAEGDQE
jgi:hypothetical protein